MKRRSFVAALLGIPAALKAASVKPENLGEKIHRVYGDKAQPLQIPKEFPAQYAEMWKQELQNQAARRKALEAHKSLAEIRLKLATDRRPLSILGNQEP